MKKLLVIVGPSGSGKSTIGKELEKLGVPQIVSHTTRAMRAGEAHGVDYYYVDKAAFDQLEKVEEVEYSGNFYCVSKAEVDAKLHQHDLTYVITDVHGFTQLKAMYAQEIVSLFISITQEQMIERMTMRGDAPEKVAERAQYAQDTGEFDNGRFTDYTIENRVFAETMANVFNLLAMEFNYQKQ